MTAGELAIVLAAVLCSIGFAALVVVLVRVLDMLRALRQEVVDLRLETRPLLAELQQTTVDARETVEEARSDLERFDKVLGSAEAIGDAVAGTSMVARTALSAPMIKMVGFARGTSRAVWRIRSGPDRTASPPTGPHPARIIEIDGGSSKPPSRRERRRRSS
jgi:hypothetical protein